MRSHVTGQTYRLSDLPETIPVFPLNGVLLLPRGRLPLNIFEPRYLAMVSDALKTEARLIGMIQPTAEAQDTPERPALQQVGCAGRIVGFQESSDNRMLITLQGVTRFEIAEELSAVTPYRQVRADFSKFEKDLSPAEDSDKINRDRLLELLREYLDTHNMEADWKTINATGGEELVNFLSMVSPFGLREKQALLEAETCVDRTEVLIALVEMVLNTPGGGNAPSLQ
ncbi:MAG: peptidase S16 [Alphaproteobacteria bacterium]|nr:MAG: peptidase S16 [Alphaproteobacteria bacterium]